MARGQVRSSRAEPSFPSPTRVWRAEKVRLAQTSVGESQRKAGTVPFRFDRENSLTIWHRPTQKEKVAPESRVHSGEMKPGLGLTMVCSGANLLKELIAVKEMRLNKAYLDFFYLIIEKCITAN